MFFAIAAGIAAAATVAQMYETSLAEQARMEQINIQEKQKQLQLTQKKISVYDQTKKVLDTQTAQATTRGVGFDSNSFNAIQRDTVNIASKEFTNINTEEELNKYSAKAEKRNVRISTNAQLFGEAASGSMSVAQSYNGYQSSKSTTTSAPSFATLKAT